MSKNVKFKLNLRGLNEIMKSREMLAVVDSAARQIAGAANGMDGEGYEAETAHALSFDGIGSVRAATREAKEKNAEHNTLLKAAGSVRL